MAGTLESLDTDEGVRGYWEQAREAAASGWTVYCCTVVVGRSRGTKQLHYQEPTRLIHVLEQSGWMLDRLDYTWLQEESIGGTSWSTSGRIEARLLFRRADEKSQNSP